jgi:hypothetical protein
VFAATQRNLSTVGFDVELVHVGYENGLRELRVAQDELVVVFVAPPWGGALDPVAGLDLRRTEPPVAEIVDLLARTFARRKVLLAVQVHESVVPASSDELRSRWQWSELRIYDLDAAGRNHGILLGSLGWSARPGHDGPNRADSS